MGRKQAIIILNGLSLKKKLFYHEYLPAISEIFEVEVHETLSRNDAKTLASKFTDKYVDVILAAGGDGTLNKVVNGVLKDREHETKLPILGVIPIGNGNDFIQSAGLRASVEETVALFKAFKPRPIDVGRIEYRVHPTEDSKTEMAYFINVADMGMGPEVVRKVTASGRPFGSTAAYLKGILGSFLTYKPMMVCARTGEWEWKGKLRSLAVANGKYFGLGMCIAPDAIIDDRIFSVFICGDVSLFDFIRHGRKLRKTEKIAVDKVFYKTATDIEIVSESPCPIEGDGEILGWLPANIKLIDRQLQFLV